jgi:hypothetical protein
MIKHTEAVTSIGRYVDEANRLAGHGPLVALPQLIGQAELARAQHERAPGGGSAQQSITVGSPFAGSGNQLVNGRGCIFGFHKTKLIEHQKGVIVQSGCSFKGISC